MRFIGILALLAFLSLCCGKAHAALIPAAGSNATTLVVFTAKRAAFTLANNLQLLNAQLCRVQTRVEHVPSGSANPSNLLTADYLVVFCPEPSQDFPAPLLAAIKQRQQGVLWVGHGLTNRPADWDQALSGPAFGERLLDFYGVQSVPPPRVLLRIEDYHCRSNHREFRRMADFLFWRGMPFAVAVLARYDGCELEADSEFVNNLRYAQRRGGRLVLKIDTLFWDARVDRAVTNSAGEIPKLTESFKSHGLLIAGWENMGPAPPREIAAEIMRVVPVRVGAVRLSDATANDQFVPVGIIEEPNIGTIIPDNLGYVVATNGLALVSAAARELFAQRGAVGSFAFPAHLPFSKLAATVDEVCSWNVAFLDLAKLKE